MRGKFITIYGINNIGKSTHSKRLFRSLNQSGIETVYVKYPVYDIEPSGSFINKILRSGNPQSISEEELQLWFTVNRYQFESTLKSHLESGKWVVAEDYVGTGLGWGAAKGIDLHWLEEVSKYLLKEDFSILLHGNRSLKSKESGHIHEENDELIEKSRVIFESLADKLNWARVEIQPKPNDTAALVREKVNQKFCLKLS